MFSCLFRDWFDLTVYATDVNVISHYLFVDQDLSILTKSNEFENVVTKILEKTMLHCFTTQLVQD